MTLPAGRDTKIIYFGLPMRLRDTDDGDCVVHGFWSWVVTLIPYDGHLLAYEGSYWAALLVWLRGTER